MRARCSPRSISSRFENIYPHMLSGGMKQRVAIARALAMEPAVLLMDEPFAALDALTRRKMQEELKALWDDVGFTVMFVTHSIEEALLVGSRILVLSPHPGPREGRTQRRSSRLRRSSARPRSRSCTAASTIFCSPTGSRPRSPRRRTMADTAQRIVRLEPPRRPERMIELDTMGAVGDAARPLSMVERLLQITGVRRLIVVVVLCLAWQLYAMWLNNNLLFPTLGETLRGALRCRGERRR